MALPSFVKSRAFVYSVALHLVVITILIIGIEPSKKIVAMGPTKPLIEAKAVNLAAIEAEKKRQADALPNKNRRKLINAKPNKRKSANKPKRKNVSNNAKNKKSSRQN